MNAHELILKHEKTLSGLTEKIAGMTAEQKWHRWLLIIILGVMFSGVRLTDAIFIFPHGFP